MSLISKINSVSLEKRLNLSKISLIAYYSRRSDSKNADSAYKVVKSKVRLEEDGKFNLGAEGSNNWEFFAPKGNRFFMPRLIGPAWVSSTTTIPLETELEKLIDFESKDSKKLHVTSRQCPMLLRKNLHELFPAPEVVAANHNLTMITLRLMSSAELETEIGARNFVLAAREMTSRLRLNGYWADFMNPFSGKPFHSYSSGRNLYKIDERFRGLCMKLETQNNCMIISSDGSFSGTIFTDAPSNLPLLESLIMK